MNEKDKINTRNQIRINGIENDSIVDGPGLRLTVFTQGCVHNCAGCHNKQTHSLDGGYFIGIDEILTMVDKNKLLDGVTYSGGEPLLQPVPLTVLSKELKLRGLNIMVYTGYLWEYLIENSNKYLEFLQDIDILVDGKFEKDKKSYELLYKGSSNQRIIDVKKSLETGEVVIWS